MKIKSFVKDVFIYTYASLCALIYIYPLFFTLLSSLKNNDEIYKNMFGIPLTLRIENYRRAIVDANILGAVLNSVIISCISVFFVLLISVMASYVLIRQNIKYKNSLLLYLTMGIMIPTQCILLPIFKYVNMFKGQNSYATMIIIYIVLNLSISIYLISNFFKGINRELDESAKIDGCTPPGILFKILVPIAMPGISTAGILAFLSSYNELLYASVLLNKKSMFTVPIALLNFKGLYNIENGPTFAAVILSIAPVIAMYILFQEKVEKGLTAGSVKG